MDTIEIIWLVLAIIGGVKIAYHLLPWIFHKLFSNIVLNEYKYGYVLITGASDGIGKSLSKEFARRGFKIILVSRTLSKLQSVKDEILQENPSSTVELISCDFSYSHRDPVSFYNDLHAKLQGFEISVLVNNVGVMDIHTLMNNSYESLENMIGVNFYPGTFLTHKLIQRFIQRYEEINVKSLIINVASIADEAVSVGVAVYSATKRYNLFFSEGLRYEYDAVDVATVRPGTVDTALLHDGGESFPFKVNVDDYARALLNGLHKGINHGHIKHKLLSYSMRIMPYMINILVLRLVMPIAVKRGLMR